MTITMIIAIIAAVIFGVFCFLCVYFLSKNLKDNQKSEERMKTLEYKMGLMGELINQKSDMLAQRMTEHENILESVKIAETPKEEPAVEEVDDGESISLDELFGTGAFEDDFEDVLIEDFEDILVEDEEELPVQPAVQIAQPEPAVMAKPEAPGAPPPPAKPVEPAKPIEPITPPPNIEERYEVGKSGKKYSFSELEQLIRE
ncbi:MAG: hypothetical protein Q4D99_06620 [Bacillota bacterium]|nr:hypothetical protein [Bacillota bacterium]